jgi:hypothetical protein
MIPIYINNFNRLTTTRNMVEYLQAVPEALPIIVDNASTYPPLLEWYQNCPCEVSRLNRNHGPNAPWLMFKRGMGRGSDYYVVTDSDLDLSGVPADLLQMLRNGLTMHPRRIKAGLSLEVRDLPEQFESTTIIRKWEARFWQKRVDALWWDANVDTTFALYRVADGVCNNVWPALRADRPYTARHVPWYRLDSEEERYFDEHADTRWSTWAGWDRENPARKVVLNVLK